MRRGARAVGGAGAGDSGADGGPDVPAGDAAAAGAELRDDRGQLRHRRRVLDRLDDERRPVRLAARRGAHVSERVDTEMRRVKRLWHDSEHRLLLLQSEVRTAKACNGKHVITTVAMPILAALTRPLPSG